MANRADIEAGDTAAQILRDHSGSLDEAIDRIRHIKASRDDLLGAVAYLACSLAASQRSVDMNASVALARVRLAIEEWERSCGDS